MNGFVMIFRQITDWEWYSEPSVCRVFIHLLLTANHAKGKWKGQELEAGQTITGFDALARETGLSRQAVRTAISKLEKSGELTRKSSNKNSVITVTNWTKYSGCNIQTTNEQHSNNIQLTANNKNNKKKKESPLSILNLPKDLDTWCKDIPALTTKKMIEKYDNNFLKEEIEKAWLWNQEQPKSKQKKSIGLFLLNWFKQSNNENKLTKRNGGGGTALDESFSQFFKG
jgi:hypothetical protein